MQKIKLIKTGIPGLVSLEQALQKRRSVRVYQDIPLSEQEVSKLLWAAYGITKASRLKTTPSAGACYPLEIYLAAGNVSSIIPGLYRYFPQEHELQQQLEGDIRTALCEAALGQDFVKQAPAGIIITAFYDRITSRYGERGVRYAHFEAGHCAQNVCLQAAALDLGTVLTGAFNDSKVSKILHLQPSEQPLYILPVGKAG